jgi:hypothetical protein
VIKHSRSGAADFAVAARQLSLKTEVRILAPGEPLPIASRAQAGLLPAVGS